MATAAIDLSVVRFKGERGYSHMVQPYVTHPGDHNVVTWCDRGAHHGEDYTDLLELPRGSTVTCLLCAGALARRQKKLDDKNKRMRRVIR
jgi:hypothetical protein